MPFQYTTDRYLARKVSEPNLFGVSKKRREKAAPAPNGAVQRLIGRYVKGYERLFHEPPVVTKADGSLMKALVVKFGEAKVEARLDAYLAWQDDYIRSSGYAIALFYKKWNELAARATAMHRGDADHEKTEAYLRSLRETEKR